MSQLLNFSPRYVAALFDRMSATYGAVNLVSSFGFSHLWRKACLDALVPGPGDRCADLMCGMGEMTTLLKRCGDVSIEAVDFSAGMCAKAGAAVERNRWTNVMVRQLDVLTLDQSACYTRVAVTFGLKTFNNDQLREFARVLSAVLAEGGRVALVEICIPPSRILRVPYLAYLRWVIPAIGRVFLGDPDCYRSLAVYTEDFARRERFLKELRDAGFSATERPLFFGCAKLFVAEKDARR